MAKQDRLQVRPDPRSITIDDFNSTNGSRLLLLVCAILKMGSANETALQNGCCAFAVVREQFFSGLYFT